MLLHIFLFLSSVTMMTMTWHLMNSVLTSSHCNAPELQKKIMTFNHDIIRKCHWPATLWGCLYEMFCTKLNAFHWIHVKIFQYQVGQINMCGSNGIRYLWGRRLYFAHFCFFCILNGILLKRFDSFVQLVLYSHSVEM